MWARPSICVATLSEIKRAAECQKTMVRVLRGRRLIGVVHPMNAVGAAEREDFAWAVAGEFVAAPAVGQTQVEDLAARRQRERGRPGLVRQSR